ncbi:MAG: MgtC/SapB family protein [Eubacteriales bacterium]|nr:MgtC/SapB family protein [Eubacteriales bacterium]
MDYYLEIVLRLVLAVFIGGVIGYEREHAGRPAGFRTHILVCVGSALVMVTSEFMFNRFITLTNMDPARLGAGVISGIGFLGAGTIIREGISIKGLTTAASLWAVACAGLAVGIGFYEGAVIGAVLIFITLMVLKNLQTKLSKKYKNVNVVTGDVRGFINKGREIFERGNATILNVDIDSSKNDESIILKYKIKTGNNYDHLKTVTELLETESVNNVYTD